MSATQDEIDLLFAKAKETKDILASDEILRSFMDYLKEKGTNISYFHNFAKIENNLDCICEYENKFRKIASKERILENELTKIKTEKDELNRKLTETISNLKQLQDSLNKI